MGKNELQDFFRQKSAKAAPADIDWTAKRDDWVQSIETLYDTIEKDYLSSVRDNVKIDRSAKKTISEPYIGEYPVHELALAVGDELVIFSPKGVNLVGAAGRIDVRGDRGEATLVRQPRDRWSLVVSRSPKLRLAPLDEDTFLEMLRSVMR